MTQQPGSGPEFNFAECSQRIAKRDSGAEHDFVRFFEPRIYAYAHRNLRPAASVEEIVQETLWAAIRALREQRLEDSNNLSAFVYGIARNKVTDAHSGDQRSVLSAGQRNRRQTESYRSSGAPTQVACAEKDSRPDPFRLGGARMNHVTKCFLARPTLLRIGETHDLL